MSLPLFPDVDPPRDCPPDRCTPAPLGTGPEGERCRSCVWKRPRGKFLKCYLMRQHWTAGGATDIRARWLACRHWQPAGPWASLYLPMRYRQKLVLVLEESDLEFLCHLFWPVNLRDSHAWIEGPQRDLEMVQAMARRCNMPAHFSGDVPREAFDQEDRLRRQQAMAKLNRADRHAAAPDDSAI